MVVDSRAEAAPLSPLLCAGDCTIANNNAVAIVNSGTGTGNAGIRSWTIDGQSQLNQEWFWYRVGGSGPERRLDTLAFNGGFLLDNDANGEYETYAAQYAGAGFTVTFSASLIGGSAGSHTSDIRETVSVQNTAGSGTLDFHLFMYTDFDLAGTSGGDSITMPNDHTIDQFDDTVMAETTVSHNPAIEYEYGAAGPLLAKLNDGLADVLNDSPALGTQSGPGDQAWAVEWDKSILHGDEYTVTADKDVFAVQAAPEPSGFAIFGLAVLMLGWMRKRANCRNFLQFRILRNSPKN
jgi:hypothetical protein